MVDLLNGEGRNMLHHHQLWAVYQMVCQQPMVEALYFKPSQGESVDSFLVLCQDPLAFFMRLDWVHVIGPFLHVEKEWFLEESFYCRMIFQSKWECRFQFIQKRSMVTGGYTVLMDRNKGVQREEAQGLKSEQAFGQKRLTFYTHLLVLTRHFKNKDGLAHQWRQNELQNIYGELAGEISPLFKERGGMTREQLKFLYEGGEALFIRYHEQFGGKEDRQITLLREVISQLFLEF